MIIVYIVIADTALEYDIESTCYSGKCLFFLLEFQLV